MTAEVTFRPHAALYSGNVCAAIASPSASGSMMCAAHAPDLQAARSYGLRTSFIYRPNEYGGGPAGVPDKAKPGDFDVVSRSLIDLAQQMGA